MAQHDEFQKANRRAQEQQNSFAKVSSARYDRPRDQIVLALSSHLVLSFRPRDAQGLQRARPAQLEQIEITPSGLGIYFPELDADIYVPAMLQGLLGSKAWMAAQLGRSGGQSRSKAKKAASRANGKLGGRPRKRMAG